MSEAVKSLIIDGKNMTVRNFFAYPETLTAAGTGTNLIHGAFLEIFKFVKLFEPDIVFVCWDSREKSRWRRGIYSEYKAGARGSMSQEQLSSFGTQQRIFQEGLGALAVNQVAVDGVEADDLVAFMAIAVENRPALIISTDRDFWQLIRDDLVRIYDPRKKSLLAGASFQQETGFAGPEHHLAYKVLKGDPGDGVPPAVKRMGETKAKALALKFNPLEPRRQIGDWVPDPETVERLTRNFKLVSLHAAVIAQMPQLIHLRETVGQGRDWRRFLTFCQKYKLKNVMAAYTEVDKLI